MNVVASLAGARAAGPRPIVAELAGGRPRRGAPLPTIQRRCLRVGDTFGFVFGNGLMANFLEEYYAERTSTARAGRCWHAVRAPSPRR